MKILILASNYRKVTLDTSSAPERMAAVLADELVKRGHNITLAASGDSQSAAELFFVTQKESISDKNIGVDRHIDYEFMLIREAINFANKNNFDLIHSQLNTRSAILANLAKMPVISTIHSPITPAIKMILERYKNNQSYISISDSQRLDVMDLHYLDTIYHGVNPDDFQFSPDPNGDLLAVGRIVPEKGFDVAIEVAKKTNKKIKIIGRMNEKHLKYFQEKIKPQLGGDIEFFEDLPYPKTKIAMSQAKILLFPINWQEPFGLVMIEAMACGTPVIAFDRGSVSEIIKDGETGFIVKPGDVQAMIKAVQRIYVMPKEEYQKMRQNCRKHAEENFTVEKMVDSYEKVYQKVIPDWKKHHFHKFKGNL